MERLKVYVERRDLKANIRSYAPGPPDATT
jgi:hypothetical protein